MQGATNRYLLVCLLLVSTRESIVYVNGDYILQVRTHSYDNPTNRCAGCGDDQGCCDDFFVFECTGELRCDNYFSYCLSTLGGSEFQCEGTSRTSSSSQPDGGIINFSRDMVLGLPNPLPLIGISDEWNGVQLVVEANDSDPRRSSPDELVDRFQIDIPTTLAPLGIETNAITFSGTFGFATIELSFRVVCAPNYFGPDCSDFCDNSIGPCVCRIGFAGEFCATNIDDCEGITCSENGVCVDGINSYQCNCSTGFTGAQCEINIDDCNGVDCNGNGCCADGINNFTCTCDLGFTGQLCEIDIDDCVGVNCSGNGQCDDGVDSFTCVCDPGFTGEHCSSSTNGEGGSNRRVGTNTGAIAGGVIGALVGLLLLVLLVILVVVLIVRKQKTKENQTYKPEHPLPGDNPVYDTTLDPSKAIPVAVPQNGQYANLNTTTMTSPPDHDFQNPLYGSPTNNPPTTTDVTTTIGSTEHDFDNPIYEADTYALPTAATTTAIYATPDEPEHYEYLSETATQH